MSIGLYTEFFGLRERPFTLLPDPDFLFWSKAHKRAFSVLEYGLMTRAPLTVITGEVGTGKTTLVQALLARVEQDMSVGLISNAQGGRGDLLRWVLNALDIPPHPSGDYVSLFQQFQDFVIAEYSAGRHVVLIIDEAQNLTVETLEELRMLTNINSNKDELLQLVLVGQPELREKIMRPELRQFAQRVTASFHLEPMNAETTRDYIRHRLVHAGGTGDEIAADAVVRIHKLAEGIPRVVNKICDLALVYSAGAETNPVPLQVVEELLKDGLIVSTRPPVLFLTDRIAQADEAAE